MDTRIIRSLTEVDAAEWNALPGAEAPFLRHEFLLALETSGCATPDTGWDTRHVLLREPGGALAGALPLYLKSHSWGEFVFDFERSVLMLLNSWLNCGIWKKCP